MKGQHYAVPLASLVDRRLRHTQGTRTGRRCKPFGQAILQLGLGDLFGLFVVALYESYPVGNGHI